MSMGGEGVMKIVISTHCDTVWKDPYLKIVDGMVIGACDNFASILAVGHVIQTPDIIIELTEDEEMSMEGARVVSERNSPEDTLIIVQDVTEKRKGRNKKLNFTIENVNNVQLKHIRKALKGFKYKVVSDGTESEAWLYKKAGFSCLEIDVPVTGGTHSLGSRAKVVDIIAVSDALKALIEYFKDKSIEEIGDIKDDQRDQ